MLVDYKEHRIPNLASLGDLELVICYQLLHSSLLFSEECKAEKYINYYEFLNFF